MRAIHWIRSRQESEEISYWLSIVSYNPKDRSFSNRIYLLYLVIFFSLWWFMVLVWFADTGAMLLALLFPAAVGNAAVGLELGILLIWFLTLIGLSLKRSPVAFTEEDATLVCQMPLNPRALVFRWSVMPWVKSLIPFLMLAIALGFSMAEVSFRAEGVMDPNIFSYIIKGLRAALVLIPVHLTAFALNWANGLWFMSRQRRGLAWVLPILSIMVIGTFLLSGVLVSFGAPLSAALGKVSSLLPNVLWAGFGVGNLGDILLTGSLVGLIAVAVMVFSASRFSASQAAQETKEQMVNRTLRRYGFSDQVRERKNQKRLGIAQRTRWLPNWTGPAALIWKDILQTRRAVGASTLYTLFTFLGVGLGLAFIQGFGGRVLLILTWALQAGKFLTRRLREDLAHWPTLRQLSIRPEEWIQADLAFSAGLVLLVSLVGMVGGAVLSAQSPLGEILSLPGMILSIAGISAMTIFKHSRIDLLMTGQAPGITEFGVLLAAVCAGLPMMVYSFLPGLVGDLLGFIISLVVASMTINASIRAYRTIE